VTTHPSLQRTLVEACVESLGEATAAEAAGGLRVELCSNAREGGITPSPGLIAETIARLRIPVVVMVRPRAGDFTYDRDELRVMRQDVTAAVRAGAHGVATGVLQVDGTVDVDAMQSLVDAAGGVPVTFHRAFDHTPDPAVALEALVRLGVGRVLTSGGASTAMAGARRLRSLVTLGADQIIVMAGGGVRADHAARLVRESGVHEVHARPTRSMDSVASRRSDVRLGDTDDSTRRVLDASAVRDLVVALGQ